MTTTSTDFETQLKALSESLDEALKLPEKHLRNMRGVEIHAKLDRLYKEFPPKVLTDDQRNRMAGVAQSLLKNVFGIDDPNKPQSE